MMDLLIRKGEEEDIPALLNLIKELAKFEKAENEVSVSIESMKNDAFGTNKIFDFIVAENQNDIIGAAVFFNKYSTWKGKCVYLDDIIVNEKYRKKGIGTLLMNAVIDEAKKRKAKRLEWQVLDWNEPAINFYKKFDAILDETWINCKFTEAQLSN
jgi:GNAT superfamily N-acetyltransferase